MTTRRDALEAYLRRQRNRQWWLVLAIALAVASIVIEVVSG